MAEINDIIEVDSILGESPVWSAREKVLYWIDIKAPAIHRFDPTTRTNESWPVGQEIGSVALRRGGGLVAGLQDGLALIGPDMTTIEWITDPEPDQPMNRFNDGKCDRQGRFWSGTMFDPVGAPAARIQREPVGVLYRLDHDHSCHAMDRGIQVSNGLAWSPDGSVMYFTNSPSKVIWAYDFDTATGDISGRRTFAEIPNVAGRGTGDGATVDAEGYYWSAEFMGGRLVRYAPDGTVDRTVELPVSRPTSCAFGGDDMSTLYVTTTVILLSETELAEQPHAGHLFALDVGVGGIPEAEFTG
ncbi:MAG: SMP-30/gluconolactonase/LRE family protein [Alphaproteobacteria bacterium]|nr:SMP-30/gluconolactonase/LRE family protein [Alphaproteobacteria bacterium]